MRRMLVFAVVIIGVFFIYSTAQAEMTGGSSETNNSTPAATVAGQSSGATNISVAASTQVELDINVTSSITPKLTWFVFTFTKGGVLQPLYLLTSQGTIVPVSQVKDFSKVTYNFGSGPTDTIATLTMESLGLGAGDSFIYGYAVSASDISAVQVPNIVTVNVLSNGNFTISGAVMDTALSDASVVMTDAATGQELAKATSDSNGKWSMTLDRSTLAAGESYLFTAINPANGISIHSIVDGSNLLSGGSSYSSDLTTISNYTEAAYLVAQTASGRKAGPFLNQYIHLNNSGLPISTGEDTIDALAVWVKGKFDDPNTANGSTYLLNLLSQILGNKWQTVVVSGTDTSFSLPSSLMGEGAAVAVSSFQGVKNVTVDNGLVDITAGNTTGQGQVVFQLSQNGSEQNLTLPITVVGGQVVTSKTIAANSTTPVTAGAFSVVPDSLSFSQDTAITISQIDLSTLPSQKIGDVNIEKMYDIQLSAEPTSPVKIQYQLSGTDDPTKVVLIHIDPATKVATYVYPDSFDAQTNELTFSLNGLSTIALGTTDSNPPYTIGTRFTVDDFKNHPADAFSCIQKISDYLKNNLDSTVKSRTTF